MKKIKDRKVALIAICAFTFVIVTWGLSFFLLKNTELSAYFGDKFGAINALFSGLAFGGVVIAIFMQMDELKLQREELKLTRNEMKGQKEQLAAQNKTLQKQNFENTFFELLRLHNQLVGSIEHGGEKNRVRGRDTFRRMYKYLIREWRDAAPNTGKKSELEKINDIYLLFYERFQGLLGHYFRNLYNIVKLVDNSAIGDKKIYTNLIRAQLSSYELLLLFYNALSDMGNEKFLPLIEKYSLIKTVPKELLLNQPKHKALYKPRAYSEE